jgi:hypothetical protein
MLSAALEETLGNKRPLSLRGLYDFYFTRDAFVKDS